VTRTLSNPEPAWHGWAAGVVPGLLLALLTTALCRAVAGVSLGFFFGGIGVVTLLVPPLVAGEDCLAKRLAVAGVACLGVVFVWLTALGESFYLSQWLACSAVLIALALALCGVCSMLLALGFNRAIAGGAVTLLAALWLTWLAPGA